MEEHHSDDPKHNAFAAMTEPGPLTNLPLGAFTAGVAANEVSLIDEWFS